MAVPRRIGVLLPMQLGYCRGILKGITRYAVPAKPWLFFPFDTMALDAKVLRQLKTDRLDGAIVYTGDAAAIGWLERWGKPVVNVAAVRTSRKMPSVRVDDQAVGAMAARHFLDRGYGHFAYFGNLASEFARERLQGYREALRPHGFDVAIPPADMPPPWAWRVGEPRLREWLLKLPKPVGIFGYTDNTCRLFATICREANVHIPEDVALVGVDNDELACEMSYPPLSSVEQPLEQIGYRASELLDGWVEGQRPATGTLVLPPIGVVTRQSSDIVAIHDADVSAAMQFIRTNAGTAIRVEDILDQVPVNRRSLEKRFRVQMGHSILTQINLTHVERAKQLLRNTRMSIEQVAAKSGFNSATRFGIVFKKFTGKTPNVYRRTFSPG